MTLRTFFLAALLTASASANTKQECVDAAQDAQALRDESKLTEARAKLLVCSQSACPKIVRADCANWLTEVDQALPSIVVRVRDAGGAPDGSVSIDGEQVRDTLDGKPITLDPGKRQVTVTLAGGLELEASVLVAAGEKNRLVVLAPPTAAAKPTPAPRPGPTKEQTPGSITPWVIGGIGAAGIVTFGVLQALARAEYSDLEQGCGRTKSCPESELSPVRTKFVASGVALGVGVVGLGIATTLLLLEPKSEHKRPTAKLDLVPRSGGATLKGSFEF